MNIALWIAQGLLAFGFVFSGWMKAFAYGKARASWPWVKEVTRGFVALIGVAELLGAVGVIVPQASNITPVLTPLAAVSLGAVVLFGAVFHIARREYREIGVNIVFLALTLFVAIGRL